MLKHCAVKERYTVWTIWLLGYRMNMYVGETVGRSAATALKVFGMQMLIRVDGGQERSRMDAYEAMVGE
jgi:hypothetical protein